MKQLGDRKFQPYISCNKIQQRIAELGNEINIAYEGKELVIISVLNGSFIFTADLVRQIEIPVDLRFIRVSSYQSEQSSGKVTQILGLTGAIKDKHVLVIEDIIDTGLTIAEIHNQLIEQQPASIEVASLLLKEDVYRGKIKINYLGFAIPNRFVVGYGLDLDGFGRNWPEIYQVV